jgi:hypothetical protein
MKKSVKSNLITAGIILAIMLIVFFSLKSKPAPVTDAEILECIGEKSTLYVQLGCTHCKDQKEILGNLTYFEIIDCFQEGEKCKDITRIPSWEIKRKIHEGVKSIEELQELTGC